MKICCAIEEGAAVVEVALLSLLVVPMVFYATFFFDLSLVNIRISEATRYAAWELTVMEISDWKNHSHLTSSNIKDSLWRSTLKPEVEGRWGDDMNSATSISNSAPGLFHPDNVGGGKSGLTITKVKSFTIGPQGSLPTYSPYAREETADTGEEAEEDFGANLRNIFGKTTGFIYNLLGFNKNGFVKIHGSAELEFIKAAPLFKGESLLPGTPIVRTNEGLLVDAWDFKDTGDIDYNGFGQKMPADDGGGEKYYNQVKHMVFAGMVEVVSGWLPSGVSNFLNGLFRNPFLPTVRSYAMTGYPSADASFEYGADRIDGLATEGDSWGKAPSKFYTNVFKESFNQSCENCNYNAVYQKNGGYYMGCDKPQMDNRQDCWKN